MSETHCCVSLVGRTEVGAADDSEVEVTLGTALAALLAEATSVSLITVVKDRQTD